LRGFFKNIILWVLKILLGIYFFFFGVMHFIAPPGLTALMAWMYDLSTTLHTISGLAEIFGGLGLILPGVTRIQTRLVPLTADSAPNHSKPKPSFD